MAESKLDKWLSGKGLLGGKKKITTSDDSQKTTKSNTQRCPKKDLTKNKPLVNSANIPPKNTKKHTPNKKGGFKGHHNKPQVFTKNNPLFDRPTVEKRDKFHPTNYLPKIKSGEIRVVPLGGMEQVGENMMFIEWGNDIIIIDTGFLFPGPEHLGIDVLIPDISYLVKNKHKIRGVVYTHGHLDHIGGAPYIIPELGHPQMYATRLTKELLLAQCSEYKGLAQRVKINDITPKSKIKLGKFEIEFFHINHSIPDGVGIVVKTPYGSIVHTSDFKFDYNPSDDQPIDLGRISQIGKQGVALALVDSTNAMNPGQTISESVIEDTLGKLVQDATGRVILATFASNIGRIAKLIESSEKAGRTVFISGRSMERNIGIARKLNYLKCKDKTVQRMSRKANSMDPRKVLILSTGSQGEELAALTRMAAGTHRDITLGKEDTVIFSSSPIPGNEMAIVSVRNNLAALGCKTINNKQLDIHVSGHAHAEECKLMTSLLNPKYFTPIHGEFYMRYAHRDLVVNDLQIKTENTFMMENGRGVILTPKGARLMTEKECVSGPEKLVQLGEIVHDNILEERKRMSETGIILITIESKKGSLKKIDINSKGFIYMDQKHEIFTVLKKEIKALWVRTYDPSRPEKALEDPIRIHTEKYFLRKFRSEQIVHVLVY